MTSSIRPAGKTSVRVNILGLDFNTPNSFVLEYLGKFGTILSPTRWSTVFSTKGHSKSSIMEREYTRLTFQDPEDLWEPITSSMAARSESSTEETREPAEDVISHLILVPETLWQSLVKKQEDQQ